MKFKKLNWGLMNNNVTLEDREALIQFLSGNHKLTHGQEVLAFEEEWSKWLGVKYSVMVNSGASANLLTMAYLKHLHPEGGEVIVPTLTWVSDISSVIQNGFTPVFVDINPRTLGMDWDEVVKKISKKTVALFPTHVLGFNSLLPLGSEGFTSNVPFLIEDCCESHGATYPKGGKVGSHSSISNFSFYFAHHLTTIEGGMICTNDKETYETFRMLRSHGMTRERTDRKGDTGFCFQFPGYNVRPTELNAVLGRAQLKRLDTNNYSRSYNWRLFKENLNSSLYQTNFFDEGSVNYAFPLILNSKDEKLAKRVERLLTLCNVEFRKGLSGGGNQLRQPYLKHLKIDPTKFPNVEHVHSYSWYIGNYPGLEESKILKLCELLNALKK